MGSGKPRRNPNCEHCRGSGRLLFVNTQYQGDIRVLYPCGYCGPGIRMEPGRPYRLLTQPTTGGSNG